MTEEVQHQGNNVNNQNFGNKDNNNNPSGGRGRGRGRGGNSPGRGGRGGYNPNYNSNYNNYNNYPSQPYFGNNPYGYPNYAGQNYGGEPYQAPQPPAKRERVGLQIIDPRTKEVVVDNKGPSPTSSSPSSPLVFIGPNSSPNNSGSNNNNPNATESTSAATSTSTSDPKVSATTPTNAAASTETAKTSTADETKKESNDANTKNNESKDASNNGDEDEPLVAIGGRSKSKAKPLNNNVNTSTKPESPSQPQQGEVKQFTPSNENAKAESKDDKKDSGNNNKAGNPTNDDKQDQSINNNKKSETASKPEESSEADEQGDDNSDNNNNENDDENNNSNEEDNNNSGGSDIENDPPNRSDSAPPEFSDEEPDHDEYALTRADGASSPVFQRVSEPGPKRYDKDFLLKFQAENTDIPDVLKASLELNSILKNSDGSSMRKSGGGRGGKGNLRGSRGGMRNSRGGNPGSGRNSPNVFAAKKVDENAWVPGSLSRSRGGGGGGGPVRAGLANSDDGTGAGGASSSGSSDSGRPSLYGGAAEDKSVRRYFNRILNKLAGENFDVIASEVINGIKEKVREPQQLEELISLIFDRALEETKYSDKYAILCQKLTKESPAFPDENGKLTVTFKRMLLRKCQAQFQNKVAKEDAAKADAAASGPPGLENTKAAEEAERLAEKKKRRRQGNIIFIGHLYAVKLVPGKILHQSVFAQLLKNLDTPLEDDLDALHKLLTTIGQKLDEEGENKTEINGYYEKIKQLSENDNVSLMMRFRLKNVLEDRQRGWREKGKK
eukprot:TRINITY_DN5516_c1_g1_i2.p1 TRINITY_DN5516_c1_g1~~TRINITY_DN5516_c1_g1_i2.p1  ORF type:complete len:782 (-),score=259.70 TRINITY_DN5516_c1_g1_i2:36-2381(-)